MDNKCFSVVILCYRHFEYLYSAIDSVLSQNYPDIELIISDDGSPNFPRQKIESYIAQHKGENIRNVVVRQEEKNVGTVKHLNHALKACGGEYIALLAGDDTFYDEKTLSNYVEGFRKAPENCYIEIAHTGMYDENLEKLSHYYLTPGVQRAIEMTKDDTTPLLQMLLRWGACLPTNSTCFRREFFRRLGEFDENYSLVEDYPMHIRLAEEGWIIHYENFVAIKHRHGGISHGQSGALSASKKMYINDSKRMIKNLILPRVKVLSPEDRVATVAYKSSEYRWLDLMVAKSEGLSREALGSWLKYFGYSAATALEMINWRMGVWKTKLLKVYVVLLLCTAILGPVLVRLFNTAVPGMGNLLADFLYVPSALVGGLWVIVACIWGVGRLIAAVKRPPCDTRSAI